MITNFEELTFDLTEDEKKLLPLIIAGFKSHVGENSAIKAPEICALFHKNTGIKLSQERLRKFVNYLRATSTLPIIATPKGYYLANNKEDLLKQIKSLQERALSIAGAADGLLKFKF